MSKKSTTTTTTTSTTSKPSTKSVNGSSKPKNYDLTQEVKTKLRKIDWKELTPIGFEFNTWDDMKKENWSFAQLNNELTEGFLKSDDHPLYVFMGAQPIVENKIALNMPYIVVVDCKSQLPNKICRASIQGGTEEILDMNKVGIAWAPYVKSKYSTSDLKKSKVQIYTLNTQDRPGKKISEDRAQTLQYMLPYIRLPKIVEEMKEPEVRSIYFTKDLKIEKSYVEETNKKGLEKAQAELDAKMKEAKEQKKRYRGRSKPDFKPMKANKDGVYTQKIEISFNKDVDNLSEYIEELIDDFHLDEDKATIRGYLKEAFDAKRAQVAEYYKQTLAEVAAYTPQMRENYENVKIYKFYPTHETIDVHKYAASRVNRFFGNADRTFPEQIERDLTKLKEVDDITKYKKQIDKEIAHLGTDQEMTDVGQEEEEEEEEKVVEKPKKPVTKKLAGKRKQMEPVVEEEKDEEQKDEEEPEEEEESVTVSKPQAPKGKKPAPGAPKKGRGKPKAK